MAMIPASGGTARYSEDFFRKAAIYWHPAFPLLARTFEHCHAATNGSLDSLKPVDKTFKNDAKLFVDHAKKSRITHFPNRMTDSVVIEGISELRLHLLTIEQFDLLADRFVSRWCDCVKTKLAFENIFGATDPFIDLDESDDEEDWFDNPPGGNRGVKKMKMDDDWMRKYSDVIYDFMSCDERKNLFVEKPVEFGKAMQVFQSPTIGGNGTCRAFRSVEYVVWDKNLTETQPNGFIPYQNPIKTGDENHCDEPKSTVNHLSSDIHFARPAMVAEKEQFSAPVEIVGKNNADSTSTVQKPIPVKLTSSHQVYSTKNDGCTTSVTVSCNSTVGSAATIQDVVSTMRRGPPQDEPTIDYPRPTSVKEIKEMFERENGLQSTGYAGVHSRFRPTPGLVGVQENKLEENRLPNVATADEAAHPVPSCKTSVTTTLTQQIPNGSPLIKPNNNPSNEASVVEENKENNPAEEASDISNISRSAAVPVEHNSAIESDLLDSQATEPTPVNSATCCFENSIAEDKTDDTKTIKASYLTTLKNMSYASHYQVPSDDSTEMPQNYTCNTFVVDGVDYSAEVAEGKSYEIEPVTQYAETSCGDSGAESYGSDATSTNSINVEFQFNESCKRHQLLSRPFSTPLAGHLHSNDLNDTAEKEFVHDLVKPWSSLRKSERLSAANLSENRHLSGRGIKFGQQTSAILKSWLDDHRSFPYPSKEDISTLSASTGLNRVQVRAWFSYRRKLARKDGTLSASLMESEV